MMWAFLVLLGGIEGLKPPVTTVVAGGSCGHILYGKLQRAASLISTDFEVPIFVGENPKPLEKLLWSQFGMATVSYSVPASRIETAGDLKGAVWFIDALGTEAARDSGGFELPSLPNPFGGPRKAKEATAGAGAVATSDGMAIAELESLVGSRVGKG